MARFGSGVLASLINELILESESCDNDLPLGTAGSIEWREELSPGGSKDLLPLGTAGRMGWSSNQ